MPASVTQDDVCPPNWSVLGTAGSCEIRYPGCVLALSRPQQPLLWPHTPPPPPTLWFNFVWGTLKTQLNSNPLPCEYHVGEQKEKQNYLKIEVKTKASLDCGLSSTQPLFHAERELSYFPKTRYMLV